MINYDEHKSHKVKLDRYGGGYCFDCHCMFIVTTPQSGQREHIPLDDYAREAHDDAETKRQSRDK